MTCSPACTLLRIQQEKRKNRLLSHDKSTELSKNEKRSFRVVCLQVGEQVKATVTLERVLNNTSCWRTEISLPDGSVAVSGSAFAHLPAR